MWQWLEKQREKSIEERHRLAVLGAFLFTGVISFVWLLTIVLVPNAPEPELADAPASQRASITGVTDAVAGIGSAIESVRSISLDGQATSSFKLPELDLPSVSTEHFSSILFGTLPNFRTMIAAAVDRIRMPNFRFLENRTDFYQTPPEPSGTTTVEIINVGR